MRSDNNGGPVLCAAFGQGAQPLLGNAQFRLRTAPEEIGVRRRHDEKIFSERLQLRADLFGRELHQEGVDQQDIVPGAAEELARAQQFQRHNRCLRPEVRRTFPAPLRIDERELHAAPPAMAAPANAGVGETPARASDASSASCFAEALPLRAISCRFAA